MKDRTQLQFIFINPNTRQGFIEGMKNLLVSKLLLLNIHSQPISKEKGSTRKGGA